MASTTTTHVGHVQDVVPVEASGPGALAGFQIRCTCGYRQGCSLPTLAAQWAMEHARWHARQATQRTRKAVR